jgi:autotransporter-associated beta strand protein
VVNNTAGTTLSGIIKEDVAGRALTLSGSGKLVLNNANLYSGGTSVSGTVTVGLGNDSALGTGPATLSGGTLSATATRAISNPVTLAGNITLGGANDMTFQTGAWTLTGNRTVTVSNSGLTTISSNIGQDVTGGRGLTKAGAGTLVLSGSASSYSGVTTINAGTLNVSSSANLGDGSATNGLAFGGGTLLLSGPIVSPARNIAVNAGGGTIDVASGNDSAFGNVTGTATLTKVNNGILTLKSVRTTGLTTQINAGGLLKIADSASGGGTSVITTLSLPGTGLDLNDNKLVVKSGAGGGTPTGTLESGGFYTANSVLGMVQTGYYPDFFGAGMGILTSQTAAGSPSRLTTLAVATGAQAKGLTGGQTALFGGQTVTSTDTLVMYTWNGDTNLNGRVDADDYFQIDSNYNKSGTSYGYFQGDFNYDGVINGDDYFLIDTGFMGQGTPFPPAPLPGGVSAVPEPTAIGLISLVAMNCLGRRRRK